MRWTLSTLLLALLVLIWWINPPGAATPPGLYTKADAGVDAGQPSDGGRVDAATPPAQDQGVTPSYLTTIEGQDHRIVLTIDDHPGVYTPAYLDLLQQYGLKATFFVVSYVLYGHLRTPEYEPARKLVGHLKRALREGHVLGNHSVSHGLMCSLPRWRVEWEVGKSQEWVKQVLGIEMKLWRPPHGHLCTLVQRDVAKRRLITIMWDVDDWRSTPESMVRIVKRRAAKGNTSTTVLFHRDVQKFRKFLLLLPPKNAAKN